MKTPTFKKISVGEIKGWLREDILDLLPAAFLEDPVTFVRGTGGGVIKESKLRWAAILTLSSGRKIFIKRDKTKGWLEIFKYFILPSKGRKEWFMAYQLQKRNLAVPKPYGWMERVHQGLVKESYYISEAIGEGVSLSEESGILKEEGILTQLAKAVKKIHDSGLFHKDLHAGNFLWDGTSFFLTDLHRARTLKSLSLNQKLWNLSHLFHSLRSAWEERERSLFIEKYFGEDSIPFRKKEKYLQKIDFWMGRLQKRHWKSRTKRCLKESTEFSVKMERGTITYRRKDFPLDRLKKVVAIHLSCVKEKPSELAKQSPEVVVSILRDGGERISVKQFRYPRLWDHIKEHFRPSKGLKSWIGGNGLRARGISSIKPLAFMERKNWRGRLESFLVMEALEYGKELDRYLLNGFNNLKEKRLFIKTCAQWLSCLHKKDIYHQDMKSCNILVSKERGNWDFKLLDLEDVVLDAKVDEKKLFKNLLQLNTSIPRTFTRTDRLRFFQEYLRIHPIIKNERSFIYHLVKKSRERGVVYVSPHGVVKEEHH
ncbi:MAG: lipopolysaccharide kinase InaA family protein [Thermodesulfobacteriota bacterium]|nr:lipopolysaccharide kinase InaA family protein [Thermodesulfobacteriota bacterium]